MSIHYCIHDVPTIHTDKDMIRVRDTGSNMYGVITYVAHTGTDMSTDTIRIWAT